MKDEAGKHIKVQIYKVGLALLSSVSTIQRYLAETVEATGMRTLGEPHVYDIKTELVKQGLEVDLNEPEGVTGIAVLSTSHVAIHTWPHRGYAIIDIFSCRDFQSAPIVAVLERLFAPQAINIADLTYSLRFPEAPTLDASLPGLSP
jgi:S-adenosylmethionine decarboxylase